MKKHKSQSVCRCLRAGRRVEGFTTVELMAVMVSGAVLAVTAGVMVFFGFVGWRRHRDALDMQRDATLAMEIVGNALRESHAASLRVTAGPRMEIPMAGVTAAVYSAAGALRFDPDIARAGAETVLLAGKVTRLSVSNTMGGVVMSVMVCEREGEGTNRYVGRFVCRN